MLYYRPISDIHLEFERNRRNGYMSSFNVPALPTDQDTVLGVAGDMDLGTKSIDFIGRASEQFLAVVMIFGNHDYWGEDLGILSEKYQKVIDACEFKNVFLLSRSSVTIRDTLFIGGTMWTNYGDQNPLVRLQAPEIMRRDFKKIRKNNHQNRVLFSDFEDEFFKTKKFIFTEAEKHDGKIVVLTHHAPSFLSIHPQYRECSLVENALYASELGNDIAYSNITLWHHGHTHRSADYQIHNTRVICNPRGYHGFEINGEFDDQLLIQIS